MILVIDIGNTNVVLGVFEGKRLLGHWRIATHVYRTTDEHGILMVDLLNSKGISPSNVAGVILSCVVPPLLGVFEEVCRTYFNRSPQIVTGEMKMPIQNRYLSPSEVGADRLVNAVAAFQEFGGPVIIVDFGTAITICAVTEKGEYLGGAIAPGLAISLDALFHRASKLPKVELTKPDRAIGRNTVGSMQSGLIYGFAGLVDELIRRIKHEMGDRARVIATGGQADLIAQETTLIEEIRPYLTLEGLRMLFEYNQK